MLIAKLTSHLRVQIEIERSSSLKTLSRKEPGKEKTGDREGVPCRDPRLYWSVCLLLRTKVLKLRKAAKLIAKLKNKGMYEFDEDFPSDEEVGWGSSFCFIAGVYFF